MRTQIKTDSSVDGNDAMTQTVETTMHAALDRYFERLTRVEAHLNVTGITWLGATDPTCRRRLPDGISPRKRKMPTIASAT